MKLNPYLNFDGTCEEADRIFSELSEGGEVESPMEDQFWGDYCGSLVDRFGTCWMINYNEASN